ncbi:tautomerase family protein [Bacteroidales bacterium OttesenSCG-928-M11]|nr:tautomerase family protein [Bacteroidales bacterium OttesenSCG-928-M11]
MPLVRISLRKELSLDTKNKISEAVHQSLVQEFKIPQDDFFQVVEELDKHQIKYPQSYLGINHSDNIVFILIVAKVGRSIEQKQGLYKEIAKRVSETTDIKADDLIISLIENDNNNWSFGGGIL